MKKHFRVEAGHSNLRVQVVVHAVDTPVICFLARIK